MPTFTYKAITKKGARVKNTVEENSKLILYRKLKQNGLSPISITQNTLVKRNKVTKKKRNTDSSREDIMRGINSAELKPEIICIKQWNIIQMYFLLYI